MRVVERERERAHVVKRDTLGHRHCLNATAAARVHPILAGSPERVVILGCNGP